MVEVVDVDCIPGSICTVHSQCKVENGMSKCENLAISQFPDFAKSSGDVNFVNFQGVDAWQLTGDGQLQMPDTNLGRNLGIPRIEKLMNFKSKHLERTRWKKAYKIVRNEVGRDYIELLINSESPPWRCENGSQADQCIDKLGDTLGMYKGKYQMHACKADPLCWEEEAFLPLGTLTVMTCFSLFFLFRILASNYTLAAWVNIPSFNFANASLAGRISIFDALGLSGETWEKRGKIQLQM